VYHSGDYCIPVRLWYASVAIMALGRTHHCTGSGDFYLWYFNHIFYAKPVLQGLRAICQPFMLMFYCTPILYASDMIPEKFSWIITYNPLASMILSWRQLFMDGVLNYEYISILYITGLVLTIVGLIFNKLKYRFAEIL
jgi:ABC-type polysaccharide/polyol phosphate export permease